MSKKRSILLFLLFLPVISDAVPLTETSVSVSSDDTHCVAYSFKPAIHWSCSHRGHSLPIVSRIDVLAQAAIRTAEIRHQAEVLLSRGDAALEQDDYLQAEQAYRQALKVSPKLTSAWLRLAQFYMDLNREKDALQILHNAVKSLPEAAPVFFQKGLIEVRLRLFSEAIISLAKAALLVPENPHYSYVYGIALNSYQRPDEALDVLHQAHIRHPDNRDLLYALVAINQDVRHFRSALKYAEKLAVLEPGNPEVQDMLLHISAAIKSSENQVNK